MWVKEVRVWAQLNHKNILRLRGYMLEGESYPALISDWMANGTIRTYMKAHPDCDLLHMVS